MDVANAEKDVKNENNKKLLFLNILYLIKINIEIKNIKIENITNINIFILGNIVYNKVYKPIEGNVFSQMRSKIENDYFTNKRMSNTFPNLRIKNENGDEVWIKTMIND